MILKEVAEWARGKDIRAMLNDLLGYTPRDEKYLQRQCELAPVQRAYKKAVLKIHPDKTDASDYEAHLKATEMFKTVNSAFETFRSANDKRGTAAPSPMETPKPPSQGGSKRRSSNPRGKRRGSGY